MAQCQVLFWMSVGGRSARLSLVSSLASHFQKLSLLSASLSPHSEAALALNPGVGGKKMRSTVAVISLFVGGHAAACDPSRLVSSSSRPLPPEAFSGVTQAMLVETILEKLGPAARDVGSGLYVLEWDVTDGRVFRVSTSSCGKPYKVGYGEKTRDRPL